MRKRGCVNVGVSVTLAMKYPHPDLFTLEDATQLLEKKLTGLVLARSGVCDCDAFYKCILHIWCQTHRIRDLVQHAYTALPPSLHDNVLTVCTVATTPQLYDNSYSQPGYMEASTQAGACI